MTCAACGHPERLHAVLGAWCAACAAPCGFVASRRALMAAAEAVGVRRGGDRGNQHTGGKAQFCALADFARAWGVSERLLDDARQVLEHGERETEDHR